jgi:hypothetical protein
MSGSTMRAAAMPASPTQSEPERTRSGGDLYVYLLIAALVGVAWWISRLNLFKAGDTVGYNLGLIGGITMLLLFTYPLRKYVRGLQRLGKVKWWFVVHMILGIGGPLLIVVHSTFRIGSLNAAVAMYSMLVVAGSGVVGRFLYLRVHRGLDGGKTSLRQLQVRAGFDQTEARSRLSFAPAVERRLQEFEDRVAEARPGVLGMLWRIVVLPVKQRAVYRECVAGLDEPLDRIAARRGWSDADRARHARLARKLVRRYLGAVARVAQYEAYVRMFALWHVAHVPFVYLLVISSVVHVIAVHAY